MKKNLVYITLLALLFFTYPAFANAFGKQDTLLVKEWIETGKKFRKSGELDSAFNYFNKADKLSSQLKYTPGNGHSLFFMALIYKDKGNYQMALKNHDMAITIMQKLGLKKHLASNYNAKGLVLRKQGKFTDALTDLFKALKIREELKDSAGIAATLANIGSVYDEQNNFDKAMEKHFQSIAIRKAIGDNEGVATCYNNIAGVYTEQKKYTEAMKYQAMALAIEERSGDKQGVVSSYNNIGVIYQNLLKYDSALKFHLKALTLKEEIGSKGAILASLINIGTVYLYLGKPALAEKYLLRSLTLAKKINELDGIKLANKYLKEVYEKLGQTGKAYHHYKEYIIARDSLINIDNVRESERIALNYEFDKKELLQKSIQEKKDAIAIQETKIKELELSRSRLIVIGLIIIVIVIILITLFIIKQNRFKAQQNNMQLEQQLLRSQMNPHFIFNSINSIQRYILQKDQQLAYNYLAKFSKLIRMVLNTSQEKSLSLKQELEMIELYVELEQLRFDNKFDFTIIMSEAINTEILSVPCMLVQPYIENAIWHGLMHLDKNKKGVLTIDMHLENDILKITVEDNGIGRKQAQSYKEANSNRSVGMKLTEQRLQMINKIQDYENAKVEIHDLYDKTNNASGTRVEIFIPIN